MSPGCRLSNVESRLSRLSHVGCRLSHVASLILAFVAFSALAEPAYTNHAGNAIAGAEKAMARSRKRAEKGLCTQEESDAFCAKSEAALRSYLDKQVKEGVVTPAERKALGR